MHVLSRARLPGRWIIGAALLLLSAGPVSAQRQPLTPDEQAAVNRAIAGGVNYLRATQAPVGTWQLAPKGPHPTGYAVLPGLTLLECGVPAKDPAVQRVAAFVRHNYAGMDHTYELALTILFLDRLGDPKDKTIIQMLAGRLIAGQTSTGGWGYRCPILSYNDHTLLLTTLRRSPKPPPPLMVGGPDPLVPSVPTGTPGVGTGTAEKPATGLDFFGPKDPGGSTGTGTAAPSPGETSGLNPGTLLAMGPGEGTSTATGDKRWRWCIKSEMLPPADASDSSKVGKNDPPVGNPGALPPKPAPPVNVPVQFRGLPVFQDPQMLIPQDPPGRGDKPVFATTDNSNTQFAILALWAAQRHDVPMDRSLNLIVRRFQTSQNQDGSWDYHYQFGGSGKSGPSMTAVGLLGLAVGHGLASGRDDKPGKMVQDPRILKGFVALNRHIGTPKGQMSGVPMANLYLLWSIERVAVLYGLPSIGNKDWYRWGAEILVANQMPNGNWDKGGYHAASPPIDTCFALLFLKQANLASDLTSKLPFNPNTLTESIAEQVKKEETDKEKPATTTATVDPASPGDTARQPDPNTPAGKNVGLEGVTTLSPKDGAAGSGGGSLSAGKYGDDPAVAEGSNSGFTKGKIVLAASVAVIVLLLLALGICLGIYCLTARREAREASARRNKVPPRAAKKGREANV